MKCIIFMHGYHLAVYNISFKLIFYLYLAVYVLRISCIQTDFLRDKYVSIDSVIDEKSFKKKIVEITGLRRKTVKYISLT